MRGIGTTPERKCLWKMMDTHYLIKIIRDVIMVRHRLQKKTLPPLHSSGPPLQCFLLPSLSLFLSLALSLFLSFFLPLPPKVSIHATAFIIIGSILFAIVDLICAHWISTGLEGYIECVAVNAIDQECRLLPLIGFEKRGPAAISRLSFQLSFYLIVLISLTLYDPVLRACCYGNRSSCQMFWKIDG